MRAWIVAVVCLLSANADLGASVKVSWTASSSGGVTSYRVYRGTASGGPYSFLGSVPASPLTDSSVVSGLTYYYVVTAMSSSGESAYSEEQSISIPGSPSSYSLSVSKAGAGLGVVSSSPSGISCGSTCSNSFVGGSSVVLTATASAGSVFSGWSGACSGVGSCTVVMTGNLSAVATFAPAAPSGSWSLVVSKIGTGSGTVSGGPIACGASCSAVIADGVAVALTAVAATGSQFTGWTGDCGGTGGCSLTMDSDKAVGALFSLVSTGKRTRLHGKVLVSGKTVVQ